MNETNASRLAVVTGASSGIGYELAQCCAKDGFDLVIASDESGIEGAAVRLGAHGIAVQSVRADLSTREGVDKLLSLVQGRPIAALLANAGHGLGGAFLDQDIDKAQHVVDTNISGTIYLLHKVGRTMRAQKSGRILITGSIAGFQPGAFQAVYNATKAFIDSFAAALRNELKDSGVSVTCLMPGVTDTRFFERAAMTDTKMGAAEDKADPADVAEIGFQAMMDGEADVVAGLKNKLEVAMMKVTPSQIAADQHRKKAQPGSAKAH
ncbi:MAG: SDR family NAD(P)-dependent oxidoreductase [Pseudomonadota bacterium]